jgi:hypothetical protein
MGHGRPGGPTLGDCFGFVMAAHENMHLGQL